MISDTAGLNAVAALPPPAFGDDGAGGVSAGEAATGVDSSCSMRDSSAPTRSVYSLFNACNSARKLAMSSAAWLNAGAMIPASAVSAATGFKVNMGCLLTSQRDVMTQCVVTRVTGSGDLR